MLLNLEQIGKSFGEKVVLENVTASVEREDRIGIVGQNGAGKTTLLKILTGEYTDYTGEFSLTHGVTLGYLAQNAKLDATLDVYGEMRATFAPVLDAMAQMQVLERKMAASPSDPALLEQHAALQAVVDAADATDWDLMWNEKYSGQILQFNNSRDAFATAQYKLGLDVNDTDKASWDAALAELKSQALLIG